MTDFEEDLAVMHEENLSLFGREISFIPSDTGVPASLRAIVSSGIEPEETDLGVYVEASARTSDFPRNPVNGDIVEIGTSRYIVVDVDATGGGSLKLLLRFDQEVT